MLTAVLAVVAVAAVGACWYDARRRRAEVRKLKSAWDELMRDFNEVSDRLMVRFREVSDLRPELQAKTIELQSAEEIIKRLCNVPQLRPYLLGETNDWGLKPLPTRYLRMAGLVP